MRPRTRHYLAALALFTSFTCVACAQDKMKGSEASRRPQEQTEAYKRSPQSGEGSAADGKLGNVPTVDPNRKVIRTGRIDIVVTTYDDARDKLDKLLAAAGGYVDSTQVHHSQGAVSSATLVLRIPQEAFGQLVPKLKELGEIASESTDAADVTDQYVDVSARLASAKTLEKRLLELAADRSSGVEALLAVERELARVRGEIESYEGRMRQWNDQIAMSTLTLTMTTTAPAIAATAEPGFGERITSGFHDSLEAFKSFGAWLAIAATSLLPWLILIVPGFLFGRRAYRRYAKRLPTAVARSAPPAPPESPAV